MISNKNTRQIFINYVIIYKCICYFIKKNKKSPDVVYNVNYGLVEKNCKVPIQRNTRDMLPFNFGRGGSNNWPHCTKETSDCDKEVYKDRFKFEQYMRVYKSIPNYNKMMGRNEEIDINYWVKK